MQTLLRYPDKELQVYFEGTFVNARNAAMLEFMGSDATLYLDRGRYVLVSQSGAHKPVANNAAYNAGKAAAEAWTLALADSFRKAGGEEGPKAAAAILVIKALVHDAMRAERPNAKFAGFTDVTELAEAIAGVWDRPAQEANGQRLWLTPKP